ncbi:MAG: S8 family serine peptidase [Clostridia bacterium]|nr:S8 family serine peptidase [Clostridia bacterium]
MKNRNLWICAVIAVVLAAGAFAFKEIKKVNEERTYSLDAIVDSIDESIPVERQSSNQNAAAILADERYVLCYRPNTGVKDFPDNINPIAVKVDKYGSFLLEYTDEDTYYDDLAKLDSAPDTCFVEEIAYDQIYSLDTISTDIEEAQDGLSYAPAMLNSHAYADKVLASGKAGSVSIAIVDTGLYSMNSAVAGHINISESYDYVNNDDNVCDGLDSHATYVGSVILDCLGNASRKADLRIAKVLENGRGSSYDAYTAILDLADRHVQLINCSWGGKTDNKMLAFAMKYAAEHNSIVVCSSGNDGGAVAYPAKYSDTIAVSACDSDGKIADFSNTGSEITYCAPGVDIVVDGVENSRRIVSGTSFSAPAITSMSAISIMDNTKINSIDKLNRVLTKMCDKSSFSAQYGNGMPVYKGSSEQSPTKETQPATKATQSPTRETQPATKATQSPTKETQPATKATQSPTKETQPVTAPVQTPTQAPTQTPTQAPTQAPSPSVGTITGVVRDTQSDSSIYRYRWHSYAGASVYKIYRAYLIDSGSEDNLKYSWVTNIAANTFEERIPDDIKVNLVYYIKIVAVDAGGRTIAESEPVKSARYLLTIENLTASVKSDAVYISFDALANVDGYDVNLKNAKTGEYISFNHSDYNGYKFNRSELQPGDYTVSVFARYNSGEGPESSVGWSSSTTFVIK